jgi:hypothetical protein
LPSGNASMRQQAGKTVPTLQALDHAKMRQAWTEPTPQALDHAKKRHAWTEPTRQALDYEESAGVDRANGAGPGRRHGHDIALAPAMTPPSV